MKFLKVGRVAIITRGRYAGKKGLEERKSNGNKNERAATILRIRTAIRLQFFGYIICYRIAGLANELEWFGCLALAATLRRDRPWCADVVIIQPVDNGNKPHPFGHAVVAGIERYPSKITRRMSKARQEKRSKVKPFIKVINYNHLMPTRYTLELEGLKGSVTADTFKEVSHREDAKKTVKKALEERYTSGKNRWFFTPLRF
ncbi:hypothetical protein PWT90_09510 [Aphanocladium album]|nr:hypothetical protein PWT90_09510 [Aphanocladium album]